MIEVMRDVALLWWSNTVAAYEWAAAKLKRGSA